MHSHDENIPDVKKKTYQYTYRVTKILFFLYVYTIRHDYVKLIYKISLQFISISGIEFYLFL